MNANAAMPIGIIDVALSFPDVLGKVKDRRGSGIHAP